MSNKAIVVLVIILALIMVFLGYVLPGPAEVLPVTPVATDPALSIQDQTVTENGMKIYRSEILGLTFEYPPTYFLEESNTGTDPVTHTTLVLTQDTAENRATREGNSPGHDGPISISIDIYDNQTAQYTPESWIKMVPASNYKLSDGGLTETTINGKRAFSYKWSGLYEADNYVTVTSEHVYSFVATYITPDDLIRKDFQDIIKNISFI